FTYLNNVSACIFAFRHVTIRIECLICGRIPATMLGTVDVTVRFYHVLNLQASNIAGQHWLMNGPLPRNELQLPGAFCRLYEHNVCMRRQTCQTKTETTCLSLR